MNKIRKIREQRGLSQAKLAELIGATQSGIGKYERAERQVTLPVLEKIAEALQCTVADLIQNDNNSQTIASNVIRPIDKVNEKPQNEVPRLAPGTHHRRHSIFNPV